MPTVTEILNELVEKLPVDGGAYFAFFAPTPEDESRQWEVHINHTALQAEDNPMYWAKSSDIESAAAEAWKEYSKEQVD